MHTLPPLPGVYILHLRLARPRLLPVGRRGDHNFPAGEYFYVGSALGPGGLKARLGRHVRGGGKPYWHIDSLRAAAELAGYCYLPLEPGTTVPGDNLPCSLECRWSQQLARLPEAFITFSGFGASDCRNGCPAHLITFQIGKEPGLATLVGCPVFAETRSPEVKWGA